MNRIFNPKTFLILIASILGMTISGCKPKDAPAEKANLTISPVTATLETGKILTVKYTIKPSNAKETISWSSADPSVAQVENDPKKPSLDNGRIKGLKAGKTIITATLSGGAKATCEVTVVNKGEAPQPQPGGETEKATLTLSPDVANIAVGESVDLKATIKPTDSKETLSWESANDKVASVSGNKVTGVGAGTTTITATLSGGASASCTVTVSAKATPTPTPPSPSTEVTSFKFKSNPVVVTMGETPNLNNHLEFAQELGKGPDGNTPASVHFEELKEETSDNSWTPLLVINSNGSITLNKPGTCRVKATRTDTNESIIGNVRIKAKEFTVPDGAKIIVSGGGVDDVAEVICMTEMKFSLTAKVVDSTGKVIPDIKITRNWNTELLNPDFTDENTFSALDEGTTEIKYSVNGTNLQTIVKVNLSFNNSATPKYIPRKKEGVGVVIE